MSEVMNQAPLLEVRNLRKLFQAKSSFFAKEKTFIKAVDDVSFTLMPQERSEERRVGKECAI